MRGRMTETTVKIGLSREVQKMEYNKYNMSPIVYKRNIVEVELRRRGEEGGCRGSRWCPTTLYSWALIFLSFIFLVSLVGTVIFWGTALIDETIIQRLVVRNQTERYAHWTNSPIKPYVALRIFNYTNSERFMRGEERLRVEEIGPFGYRETLQRVNVRFNPNGTVTYQERRSYEFIPQISNGSLDDYIIVPNVALLGASALFRDMLFGLQLGVSVAFQLIDYQPFIRVKVKDFIWGYDDPVVKLSQALLSNVPNKVGLLAVRNGTSPFVYTINTGEEDVSRIGMIDRYKGHDRHNIWDSDHCNKINGTDGSIYPAHWIGEHQKVHIYMPDMCRNFPLVFKEHVEVYGVPALRFHAPRNVFDPAPSNPDNACYCNHASCPPAGVFNASPCASGLPVMISFPHFYLGDPKLLEDIEGMNPREDIHDMYFDMHPKYGFPIAGLTRFQFNFMVRKSSIANFEPFREGTILPIAWFEAGLENLPEDLVTILHHLAYTKRNVEVGVLCTAAITGLILAVVMFKYVHRSCYSLRARRVADVYMSQIIMTASPSDRSDKKVLELA